MPPPPQPPWHHHLTLDLLLHTLTHTLLSPFLALLLLLSLLALSTPPTHAKFLLTSAWTALLILARLAARANHRLAHGPPRKIHWPDELVVVTGGAAGLGRAIAQILAIRGVSVAVLDLRRPHDWDEAMHALPAARFFACDVADRDAVQRAAAAIAHEFPSPPTILINNAAAPIHGLPLLSLPPTALSATLATNTTAHFHTLQAFLPGMLAAPHGGHVVTVSSVLGVLGAARLADYSASKAAATALHQCLRAECAAGACGPGSARLRFLLVETGQLATSLFSGLASPRSFFAPVVTPVEVAGAIVRALEAGSGGEIQVPAYARWARVAAALPGGLQRVGRGWSGVDEAVGGWRGGGKGE